MARKPTKKLLGITEFGDKLLEIGDLDPVYTYLWEAELPKHQLERFLIAYWCYYDIGTAAWICDKSRGEHPNDVNFWVRMRLAASTKRYPRGRERRHFRGNIAHASVKFLEKQGIDELWLDLDCCELSLEGITEAVSPWIGFGKWIIFKIADMVDRLDFREIEFKPGDIFEIHSSPAEAINMMYKEAGKPDISHFQNSIRYWGLNTLAHHYQDVLAPPRFERPIHLPELETILCKWGSYKKGHYCIGEDVEQCRMSLLRQAKNRTAQQLIRAGKDAKLWDTTSACTS